MDISNVFNRWGGGTKAFKPVFFQDDQRKRYENGGTCLFYKFIIYLENKLTFSSLCLLQEVAHGLKELLKYEGDVEDDMCLSFQVSLLISTP